MATKKSGSKPAAKSTKDSATLLVIKPDGIKKSLTGNIITRLSETKLKIIACKMKTITRDFAEIHYSHLIGKPFFEDLMKYIMGDYHTRRVMALVYYGPGSIEKIRDVCGSTNPEEAEPYSIRGSYGRITTKGVFENVVHASANAADAEREIKLWFAPEDFAEFQVYPSKKVKREREIREWA